MLSAIANNGCENSNPYHVAKCNLSIDVFNCFMKQTAFHNRSSMHDIIVQFHCEQRATHDAACKMIVGLPLEFSVMITEQKRTEANARC